MSTHDIRHAEDLAWTPSPGGEVERKRFRLRGPEESGQVSSLVRYRAGARFPRHAHPEGEEILVLDGTFSDHDGDYVAATHLLNPEGHEHAPWSDPGCLLFVRLRQYAGPDRPRQMLHTDRLQWRDAGGGRQLLHLQRDALTGEERRLERWEAGLARTDWISSRGGELFIVSGTWKLGTGTLQQHDWVGLAAAPPPHLTTETGGEFYLFEAGESR